MNNNRRVAIVGGGFFGVLAALRLSQAGFDVTIFEKQTGLMLGASYINQNRLHMGYHYPRSDETARDSCLHQVEFQALFPESVVGDFEHYYCVAREGSYVSGKEFTDFCDRLRLPYEDTWPKSSAGETLRRKHSPPVAPQDARAGTKRGRDAQYGVAGHQSVS